MVANRTWANMKATAIRTEGDIQHMAKLAQSYAQNQARSVHQVQQPKKPDVNNNSNNNKVKINPQQSGNQQKTESKVGNDQERKFNPCYRCGRRHNCKTCPAVNWECNFCKKMGHTSTVCRKKKKPEVRQVSVSRPPPEADFYLCGARPGEASGPVSSFNVNLVQSSTSEPLINKLLVNNIRLKKEIHSGSAVSLISIQEFQSKYPDCSFSSSSTVLSVANKKPLKVLDNAIPVKHRAYKVPLAITDNVNQILNRMEAQGKAIRVRHASWASPSFPVSKKNGDYRLVVDFKKNINPRLRVDYYPIPSPEEIFSSLSKSVSFVTLDLKDAYMQLELSPQSQELCVMATHRGFYKLQQDLYIKIQTYFPIDV
ncbi:hypothetical protein KUF71_006567 [Frankliniella fusca]|uniref:Reverse transcriptase domain-containing protein n=1 Tax=Frankliniella fusca TaxID=407009 RepID=A0AAE1LUS0_9NEOP|nr:hypothetical protein KUF71_006567 [Frankliniella fusca]